MEIIVRRAKESDLNTILKLNLELFKHDMQFDPTLNLNWTFSDEGGGVTSLMGSTMGL